MSIGLGRAGRTGVPRGVGEAVGRGMGLALIPRGGFRGVMSGFVTGVGGRDGTRPVPPCAPVATTETLNVTTNMFTIVRIAIGFSKACFYRLSAISDQPKRPITCVS